MNTNAFWAYLLSVWTASAPWQPKRLWAVLIAVFGVFVIVYGGASREPSNRGPNTDASSELVGDAATLLASILYAFYQVTYKRYVALPNRLELGEDDKVGDAAVAYEPIPTSSLHPAHAGTGVLSSPIGRRRALSIGDEPPRTTWNEDNEESAAVYPAFGLHPNFITSCIGLATFLLLWPLIIALHYAGIETFRLPDDMKTWYGIMAVSVCGVAYNVGFMVRVICRSRESSQAKLYSEFFFFYAHRFFFLFGVPHSPQWGISSRSCWCVSFIPLICLAPHRTASDLFSQNGINAHLHRIAL